MLQFNLSNMCASLIANWDDNKMSSRRTGSSSSNELLLLAVVVAVALLAIEMPPHTLRVRSLQGFMNVCRGQRGEDKSLNRTSNTE